MDIYIYIYIYIYRLRGSQKSSNGKASSVSACRLEDDDTRMGDDDAEGGGGAGRFLDDDDDKVPLFHRAKGAAASAMVTSRS